MYIIIVNFLKFCFSTFVYFIILMYAPACVVVLLFHVDLMNIRRAEHHFYDVTGGVCAAILCKARVMF
jgi:hypothetical protein